MSRKTLNMRGYHTSSSLDAAVAVEKAHRVAYEAAETPEADRYYHEMQAGLAVRASTPGVACDMEVSEVWAGKQNVLKFISDLGYLKSYVDEGNEQMADHMWSVIVADRYESRETAKLCIWDERCRDGRGGWFGGSKVAADHVFKAQAEHNAKYGHLFADVVAAKGNR